MMQFIGKERLPDLMRSPYIGLFLQNYGLWSQNQGVFCDIRKILVKLQPGSQQFLKQRHWFLLFGVPH